MRSDWLEIVMCLGTANQSTFYSKVWLCYLKFVNITCSRI